MTQLTHAKWPSIEAFHNLFKTYFRVHDMQRFPEMTWRAKIKLHGTNAAVAYDPATGEIAAQKRTTMCKITDDNAGFAAWVARNETYWTEAFSNVWNNICQAGDEATLIDLGMTLIFHGEWCGPGIQKNTALTAVPHKFFAIYAIETRLTNPAGEIHRAGEDAGDSYMLYDPELIRDMLPRDNMDEVFTLPWYEVDNKPFELTVNFYQSKDVIESKLNVINDQIAQIEKSDPWVKKIWNVEGTGEGLVFYPRNVELEWDADRNFLSHFMFKAKGEEHRVNKEKQAVQIDPEKLAKYGEFAEKFVTPARLDQAVNEACSGLYEITRMKDFLKWMGEDIAKEAREEFIASGLEWKPIAQACSAKSSAWYKQKCYTI